jgi:hypothetical protein
LVLASACSLAASHKKTTTTTTINRTTHPIIITMTIVAPKMYLRSRRNAIIRIGAVALFILALVQQPVLAEPAEGEQQRQAEIGAFCGLIKEQDEKMSSVRAEQDKLLKEAKAHPLYILDQAGKASLEWFFATQHLLLPHQELDVELELAFNERNKLRKRLKDEYQTTHWRSCH